MGSGERGDRISTEIVVIGCGEAFDETVPNTSLLVRTGSAKFLLDCGYSVPQAVWRTEKDQSAIDLIYISHAHADHYFGLPGLLGRMWEEGRTKPLVIVSQESVLRQIDETLELGYRKLRERYKFSLELRAVTAQSDIEFAGSRLRFASTTHSSPNLAVRIDTGEKSVCYSGDGAVTPESLELYRGANVLVHEAFDYDPVPIHASIRSVLETAGESGVGKLALVHLRRGLRSNRSSLFGTLLSSRVRCTIPQPGDTLLV